MTLFETPDACRHGREVLACPFCRTRRTDPDTSLDAARKAVTGAPTIRANILAAFHRMGPMTGDQLTQYFRDHDLPGSESGIRTRRKELEEAGLVRWHSEGVSRSGNRSARYYAPEVQS